MGQSELQREGTERRNALKGFRRLYLRPLLTALNKVDRTALQKITKKADSPSTKDLTVISDLIITANKLQSAMATQGISLLQKAFQL
jgi:hypothetical protein